MTMHLFLLSDKLKDPLKEETRASAFSLEFVNMVVVYTKKRPTELPNRFGFVQIELFFGEFLYFLYGFLFIKFSAATIITMPSSSEFIF